MTIESLKIKKKKSKKPQVLLKEAVRVSCRA